MQNIADQPEPPKEVSEADVSRSAITRNSPKKHNNDKLSRAEKHFENARKMLGDKDWFKENFDNISESDFAKACQLLNIKFANKQDFFDNGHSSTSISQALGLLSAWQLQGRNDKVVAIIGDGALTGGMAFEALSHAGQIAKNLIVVLNDNQRLEAENKRLRK